MQVVQCDRFIDGRFNILIASTVQFDYLQVSANPWPLLKVVRIVFGSVQKSPSAERGISISVKAPAGGHAQTATDFQKYREIS